MRFGLCSRGWGIAGLLIFLAAGIETASAQLNQTSTTVLTVSPNPINVGESVTLTATATNNDNSFVPTGTLALIDTTTGTTLGSQLIVGGPGSLVHSINVSTLTAGTHAIQATFSGGNYFYPVAVTVAGSTSSIVLLVVNKIATTTTLTSAANPSNAGQAVTFTATVTPASGGPATGTVTFRDGATVIGSGTLSGGTAALTTSSLAVGTHAVTATYEGDANFASAISAPLTQAVQVPPDSIKLRAMQIAATKIVAQGSGQAITGAADAAIGDGFAGQSAPFTMSPAGMRFNFAAEAERMDDAFSALGYNGIVRKAQPMVRSEKVWLPWLEVRGTGFDVDTTRNGVRVDITGTQVNAIAGLTRKLAPSVLVGVLGGYETFDYTSQQFAGRLKGDGWTLGGYLGWKLLPGLRLDAIVARSGVNYGASAGTATASFPGTRWLASGGLTGTHRVYGLEIQPSMKAYALWEREDGYIDTLGMAQTERNFTTGRASGGVKLARPIAWAAGATVTPYVGAYADYYFSRDDATAILMPAEFLHGWSARVTSGLAVTIPRGPTLFVGGEVGGLGSDFTMWTIRGRASVPF